MFILCLKYILKLFFFFAEKFRPWMQNAKFPKFVIARLSQKCSNWKKCIKALIILPIAEGVVCSNSHQQEWNEQTLLSLYICNICICIRCVYPAKTKCLWNPLPHLFTLGSKALNFSSGGNSYMFLEVIHGRFSEIVLLVFSAFFICSQIPHCPVLPRTFFQTFTGPVL